MVPFSFLRFGSFAPPFRYRGDLLPIVTGGGGTLFRRVPLSPGPLECYIAQSPSRGLCGRAYTICILPIFNKTRDRLSTSPSNAKNDVFEGFAGDGGIIHPMSNDMGMLSLPEETFRVSSGLGLRSKAQTNREMPATRIGNADPRAEHYPREYQSTFIE